MIEKGLISLISVSLFALLPCAFGGSIGTTWTGSAGDGSWNTAVNWSSAGVPNNGGGNTYVVTIGTPGGTVALAGGISIDGLMMTSTAIKMTAGGSNSLTLAAGPSSLINSQIIGGTLTTNGTLTLGGASINSSLINNGVIQADNTGITTLTGTVTNNAAGVININSAPLQLEAGGTYTNNGNINVGTGGAGALVLDGSPVNGASGNTVTLGGTGTLTLGNNSGNAIMDTGSTVTLVNGAGHTIQGAGMIGDPYLSVNNQGTIVANQSAGMTIGGPSIVNSGTMTAAAGGGLTFYSNSIDNTGGTIAANGGMLNFQGGLGGPQSITGGAVNVINGGGLLAVPPTTMNGVTLTVGAGSNALVEGAVQGGAVKVSGTLLLSGGKINSDLTNSGTVNAGAG